MSKIWWIIGVMGIVLAAGLAWWFWPEDDQDTESTPTAAVSPNNTSCAGRMIDSHTHFDDDEYPDLILPYMTKYGVGCAVMFRAIEVNDLDDDLDILGDLNPHGARFLPFFNLDPETPSNLTESNLKRVIDSGRVKIAGLGEYAFYQDPLTGTDVSANPWPAMFQFASDNNLVLMLHLTQRQQSGFESMLERYPATKVLVHGIEIGPEVWKNWLVKYPNLYYTYDAANILRDSGPGKNLMYPGKNPSDGSADGFLSEYGLHKSRLLAAATQNWKPVIEAAPDKVLWGTDVSASWHFDSRVYAKLMELSEEFIAVLPPDIQEKYRFQNAAKLFGLVNR